MLSLLATATVLLTVPATAQNNTGDTANPSDAGNANNTGDPANTPVLIVDPSATITFNGNGWGHGVGMSQWGARGRAEAGHSTQEILQFYYPGSELVANYGYPETEPAPPEPTPTPAPPSTPSSPPSTTNLQDPAQILLATTNSTVLTPEGFNRISINNQNLPSDSQPTRVPAGTPITVTREAGVWRISYNGTEVCSGGCVGETAQLHFATNTAVNVSTTGRSYSHGRINLVATAGDPNRFHITLDSLSVDKFLNDPQGARPASAIQPNSPIQIVVATAEATTLTPEGLNRITVDNQNISVGALEAARAPSSTPITIARTGGLWRISYNGTDICPNGCAGQTAQLHFATNTAVNVSTTGRSYSHGRINLVALPEDPTRFQITLDSLTITKFFNDPHGTTSASVGNLPVSPTDNIAITPPAAQHPEESIGVHLATTTQTTLTPRGTNRITIDNQQDIRVAPNTQVTFMRHAGHWHITYNGVDVCGTGCSGHSAQLHFATDTSVVVSNTGRSYSHGRINLVPISNSAEQFDVVLDWLNVEEYLRGIAEIPTSWPAVAQDTQAIAARSYAVASIRQRRASPGWNRPYDLYATVQDQAFVGDTREQAASAAPWLDAVERTAKQTLIFDGSPVRAFYSSSNGGHTETSGYVFTTDMPYLVATPDLFDNHADNPNHSWTHQYRVSDFNQWLNDHPDTAVGQLIGMQILGGVGSSGRLDKAEIKITGTQQEVIISGTRLNNRLYTAAGKVGQPRPLSTKVTFALPTASVPLTNTTNITNTDTTTTQEETNPTSPPEQETPEQEDTEPKDTEPAVPETFYTGVISGPDFCITLSIGGPITYPHDSDNDGVADICSLKSTRREEAARQRALDRFEQAAPELFELLLAEACWSLLAESFGEPDKEPQDECAQAHNPNITPPAPSSTTHASSNPTLFFSGPVVTSPEFCTNFSLGGTILYPHDRDGDAIADICSLKSTRRVAVARQRVLAELTSPDAIQTWSTLLQTLFAESCRHVVSGIEDATKEAADACAPHIGAGPAT